jgi:hypothetical protein
LICCLLMGRQIGPAEPTRSGHRRTRSPFGCDSSSRRQSFVRRQGCGAGASLFQLDSNSDRQVRCHVSPAPIFEAVHGSQAGRDTPAIQKDEGRTVDDPPDGPLGVGSDIAGLHPDTRSCLVRERCDARLRALDPFLLVGPDYDGRRIDGRDLLRDWYVGIRRGQAAIELESRIPDGPGRDNQCLGSESTGGPRSRPNWNRRARKRRWARRRGLQGWAHRG